MYAPGKVGCVSTSRPLTCHAICFSQKGIPSFASFNSTFPPQSFPSPFSTVSSYMYLGRRIGNMRQAADRVLISDLHSEYAPFPRPFPRPFSHSQTVAGRNPCRESPTDDIS